MALEIRQISFPSGVNVDRAPNGQETESEKTSQSSSYIYDSDKLIFSGMR